MRLKNVRARLGNVKARLKNAKPQKSFSEANKARHLQLHLPRPDGNMTEHQQLHQLWLEDNRFGIYRAEESLLLGLTELESIAEVSSLKE